MADNKKYYYLKLKDNFFDTDEMIILESMPDGYLYSNILLKLYLRSLKYNGRLMFNERIPFNSTMLSQVTRHSVGVIEKAMQIFQELNLVEVLDNGAIYMSDIQNFIGTSSTEGDRKRKYRQKIEKEKKTKLITSQKQGVGQMSDKRPPEIEIELELEKKKEKEKDKYNTSENHQHLSCERYEDEVFPNQLKIVEYDNFSNTNIREDTDRYAYVEDNNIYKKADFPQNGKNGKTRLTSQLLQEIIENWNNLGIGKVRDIRVNTKRYKRIKGIIDDYGYDDFINVMNSINDSPFLKGKNDRNWKITMDWFVEPNNYQKVRDGNYINNNNGYSKPNPEQNNSAIDMFSSK